MWKYEKKLLFPVKITEPDLRMARLLLEPYAGGTSELSEAVTYLNQRYAMPSGSLKALLTDISTEELAHMEIIASMISQCLQGRSQKELKVTGWDSWYAVHRRGLFSADSHGHPWSASYTVSSGDPAADIAFDMAMESRQQVQYERLIALSDNKSITEPLEFLREREIVHYQRFAEALEILKAEKQKP
jgi:spore coat protein JC